MLRRRTDRWSLLSSPRNLAASTLVVLLLAAILSVDAVDAGAAKTAHKQLKLTQILFQISSSGNPPASGSNSAVGTSNGSIGGNAVRGTVRGTNTYPAFTGHWIMFDPTGSIDFSLKGHIVGQGHFAGTANVTGGTGKYRHAGGTLTFTAHTQTTAHGESHPAIVRKLTGTLSLP